MLNWIDDVRGTGAATPVMVKSSAPRPDMESSVRLCPSGSAPPKRRWAISWPRTTELRPARAVAASPRSRGKSKTSKKAGSTRRNCSSLEAPAKVMRTKRSLLSLPSPELRRTVRSTSGERASSSGAKASSTMSAEATRPISGKVIST